VKWGNKNYLCHELTKPILKQRYGLDQIMFKRYLMAKEIDINGVKLSLHPAGHVIGSSQIRLEYKGEICVVSGDYKVEYDGISAAFEPIKCHTFVSESTFGLPIYTIGSHRKSSLNKCKSWVADNHSKQKTSILVAYSLGKAQRLIKNLDGQLPYLCTQFDSQFK
jgi:putative mRNA 3-end processing factor